MTSTYSGSFTNYSLSNAVYTNESGSSYFTWTVPYHLTITSFIMNVSGQTNGGGWGIFYAWLNGGPSILKGDEYYPAAPDTLTELSIPISAFSKVTFNKGDAIQFKWSTLQASGRPFYSRYLDNPPYTPPSNIDLPIKITYTYTQSAYTVGTYTYNVPSGVSSINIKAWGGGGSGGLLSWFNSSGGNAAMVEGNLAVTPGEVLTIDVAGGGTLPTGGSVGGGNGSGSGAVVGAGGGGCTIIKNSANANLVMVGGGGGAGYECNGGYGGITNGQNGGSNGGSGFGGTQFSGGAGGTGPNGNGGAGGLGTGGNGATNAYVAGGGSGYWGGGGGALGGTGNAAGAGGGGSSLYTNLTSFVGYAWDGDSTHKFANIPDYGQPAGTGVGGVNSDVSSNTVGGDGYVIISPGSSGICFRDSTRVLMSDGTFKAIKDIQRGDEILTDKKKGDTKKVARTLKYMATGKATQIPMHLIGNRRSIVCSSTHPFWVSDTRRILAGDIEGTEIIEISEWLYTIQFEDEGTYYVEGVKVDAVSPDHRKFKLPKELYFDQTKYKPNRVMKSEDDQRRKKPNMTKHL